jgi:hypothetical protein
LLLFLWLCNIVWSQVLWYFLCCSVLCWLLFLDDLSIAKSGVLIIFSCVCLMKLVSPMSSAYVFMIVITCWWIVNFINMMRHSLSLLTTYGLKSVLSEICIATHACFEVQFPCNNLFHPFTLSLVLFLSVRYISCGKQMGHSFFF